MSFKLVNWFSAQNNLRPKVIKSIVKQVILVITFSLIAFNLSAVGIVNAESKVTTEVVDVYPNDKESNWWVQWNVCSEKDLLNPWFRVTSDVEFFTVGVEGLLLKGNCDDVTYQIGADDPESIELSYVEKHPTKKTIILLGAEKSRFTDKYLVSLRICSGENQILNPEIIAKSDIDNQKLSFFSNIGPGSCLDHDLNLKANDLDTIAIDFVNQLTSETKFEIENKVQNISNIPDWIKNNAKWWSEGQISDSEFTSCIQYLIKENIMVIPELPISSQSSEEQVPDWVRSKAGWWADGLISEGDFVSGIRYLVEFGLIRV